MGTSKCNLQNPIVETQNCQSKIIWWIISSKHVQFVLCILSALDLLHSINPMSDAQHCICCIQLIQCFFLVLGLKFQSGERKWHHGEHKWSFAWIPNFWCDVQIKWAMLLIWMVFCFLSNAVLFFLFFHASLILSVASLSCLGGHFALFQSPAHKADELGEWKKSVHQTLGGENPDIWRCPKNPFADTSNNDVAMLWLQNPPESFSCSGLDVPASQNFDSWPKIKR